MELASNTSSTGPGAVATTTTGPSSSSSSASQQQRRLSSLQIEVLEVRNADMSQPMFVQLEVAESRLRVHVKSKSQRPDAVLFTQKHLEQLYTGTLVCTLFNKETKAALGKGSLPVKKLMIGRKIDYLLNLGPEGPETTTSGQVCRHVLAWSQPRLRWGVGC